MLSTRLRMRYAAEDGEFYTKEIDHSCRFNDNDSAYLYRTQLAGNRYKWKISFWFKRCNLGIATMPVFAVGSNRLVARFNSNNALEIYHYNGSTYDWRFVTTQVFRDVIGCGQLEIESDTQNATASERIKIIYNASRITDLSVNTQPAQNFQGYVNKVSESFYIGRYIHAAIFADIYIADFQLVDGDNAGVFGESKYGIRIPKEYTGSYGTNGSHLDFANSAALGNDPGNNLDFTSSGLASEDQVEDSPTNNYPVLSSINKPSTITLANGSLNPRYSLAAWATILATKAFPLSGKWYFEYKVGTDLRFTVIGVRQESAPEDHITLSTYIGKDTNGWGFLCNGSVGAYQKYYNATNTTITGETPSASDVMQVAIDIDAGKIWFGSNNTWLASGDPAAGTNEIFSGLTGTLIPGVSLYQTVDAAAYINFGQLGFAHTPPTGFQALCSANFDDPGIQDCSKGVVTAKDTGANIAATLAAARSGWGSYIDIFKNLDAAESWDIIFSNDPGNSIHFDTDAAKGTKQSLVSGNNYLGASLRVGATYGCYTAEISHTNGSETNQAHGLGSADVAIAKLTNIAGDWWMSHPKLTANYNIKINTTAGETATEYVEVDNTNVTIKSAAGTGTYRVIVFKEIDGFSKFGKYKGNGNADGTFSHSGLRPALSLIKDADGAVNWLLFNKDRLGYNVDNNEMHPNTNDVEGTTDMVDLLSNGKKMRTTNAEINTSAHDYIFLDWAEQPAKWANAR